MVGNCSRNMFKELYKLLINNLLYVIFTNFLLFLLLRQVAVNTQYFNIATINRLLFRNNIRLLSNKTGLLTNKAGLCFFLSESFGMFIKTVLMFFYFFALEAFSFQTFLYLCNSLWWSKKNGNGRSLVRHGRASDCIISR